MGVFIKDLEMPKDCCDCPCHNGENGTCNLLKRTTYDSPPKDCPMWECEMLEKES